MNNHQLKSFLNTHQHRIVGLDIMRTIAILIVVFEHGKYLVPSKHLEQYDRFNIFQIDGVTIFFVLSGFLIGRILLRLIHTTEFTIKDIWQFWIRRWFRTLPNYFLVLIGILIASLIFHQTTDDFNFRYIFFLQNFWSPHPDFFAEAWSLTIEEWFYLLFPMVSFLFYKLLNNRSKTILYTAILFLIIPVILRIIKYENGIGLSDFDSNYRKILVLRLDSIMYGIVGAYLFFKYPKFWSGIKWPSLFLGGIVMILLYHNPSNWINFYRPIAFNIHCITTLLFLPYLSVLKTTKRPIVDALFIFISIISYSMYLLNRTPIFNYFMHGIYWLTDALGIQKQNTYAINYITFWVVTILFSWLLYNYFEYPMTQLRERFTKK